MHHFFLNCIDYTMVYAMLWSSDKEDSYQRRESIYFYF